MCCDCWWLGAAEGHRCGLSVLPSHAMPRPLELAAQGKCSVSGFFFSLGAQGLHSSREGEAVFWKQFSGDAGCPLCCASRG